jgi:NhaP-type Na+/H+ or K+/H+ antiporter
VATCAHALGLGWGPAWVLGAAVAPTDATAVGVLARSLPRRTRPASTTPCCAGSKPTSTSKN